jgi:hypothetical protein
MICVYMHVLEHCLVGFCVSGIQFVPRTGIDHNHCHVLFDVPRTGPGIPCRGVSSEASLWFMNVLVGTHGFRRFSASAESSIKAKRSCIARAQCRQPMRPTQEVALSSPPGSRHGCAAGLYLFMSLCTVTLDCCLAATQAHASAFLFASRCWCFHRPVHCDRA